MTEQEARELAAKREKHKAPGLHFKRWAAVHDSVKGWHVTLVDNFTTIAEDARSNAKEAVRRGDPEAFMRAAHENLMARCKAHLNEEDK